MHKRQDFPAQDPGQHHRIISGGLDEVWTAPEPSLRFTPASAAVAS
jgi:hypothetical protein